jgi:uncharacterized protein (TIGR03086 family)
VLEVREARVVRPTVALIHALTETEVAFGRLTVVDMARPTCCSGWNVRQVLDHTTATTSKFAAFAAGDTDAPRTPAGDLLGSDPARAFAATASTARRAWASVDRARRCHLPFGVFTAEQAAGINLFDLLAHYSDITDAVGTAITGTVRIWQTALEAARRVVGDEDRDLDHYAPAQPVAPDAPVSEQLRAYLGRLPRDSSRYMTCP